MKVIVKAEARSAIEWLPANQTLTVLAVSSFASVGSKYLIWSEAQQCPALFPASDFEIVDSHLPAVWIASLDLNGYIHLAPPCWHEVGFWERYYEGEHDAELVFKEGTMAVTRDDVRQ